MSTNSVEHRLAVIGSHISVSRYEAVNHALTQVGQKTVVDVVDLDKDEQKRPLRDLFFEIKEKYLSLRLTGNGSLTLQSEFTSTSVDAFSTGAFDILVKSGSKWWPKTVMGDVILECSHLAPHLDITESALITGTGAKARICAAALVRLGYRQINITDLQSEGGPELIADLKRRFFNVDFVFVEAAEITALPGAFSMLINTAGHGAEDPLLQELSYFNFLVQGGLVIDLVAGAGQNVFRDLAIDIGAKVISGEIVAARLDRRWIEVVINCDLGPDFVENIVSKWKSLDQASV
jgi:shikimate 5-dehydrogenase